ncbi:MAG: hypothetical protein IJ846_02345 [Alphaproteobacteria bacterium]|nr:hypothetical protein [Alphaproteobacteria bacterium]
MKATYRTPNAFFVSPIGKRLQKQIDAFFAKENLRGSSAVLIGPVFPFLAVFEQNNPNILFETEYFIENSFFTALPPPFSVETVFIAALNDSVLNNCSLLIKEASRLLKPQGRLFFLIKNKRKTSSVEINEMPDAALSSFYEELQNFCFFIQKKKGLIYFPYTMPFWEKADQTAFSLLNGGGNFSLLCATKNLFTVSSTEDYSSTRITKASVLTSPRI